MNQHFGELKKWHYFFKQETRFDMHPEDVFDESLTELFFCCDHSKKITTCLGYMVVVTTTENLHNINKEQRFVGQLVWHAKKTEDYTLTLRTRLELRDNFARPDVACRVREKIKVHFLRKRKVQIFMFEEFFINLTNTEWITKSRVDQNRVFAGVKVKHTPNISWNIGYLNQVKFRNAANLMNHAAVFEIHFKLP